MKDQLRPFPPQLLRKRFKVRDAVETLYNDAWWVGFIKHHNPKENTYQIYYGGGQPELELPFLHIRSRQEYVRPSGPELKWSWSIVRPMQVLDDIPFLVYFSCVVGFFSLNKLEKNII